MNKPSFSIIEKSILLLISIIWLTGFILYVTNIPAFETYIQEDGIIEWLTVLGLLLSVVVCINRFIVLKKERSWFFIYVTLQLALLLFFAAGEEISWGQRLFGIQSSDYFKQNNAQAETNLHNLVVDGVKLNKLLFSIGLSIMMGIYLIVVPLLYSKNKQIRIFLDRSGVPVPQLYQILSIVLLFGLTELIRHGKRAEILEAGITLLFFLIIKYPINKRFFEKTEPGK